MKTGLKWIGGLFVIMMFVFCGCDPEEPTPENEEEIINKVTLTFSPAGGSGPDLVYVAFDPDGDGSAPVELDEIILELHKTYTLSLKLENTLEGSDITSEIEDEGDEHMFYFGWSDVFINPVGPGNIGDGQRDNDVNYNDFDINGLPIGLSTTWATVSTPAQSNFRLLLKHQPGIKSFTTTSEDGETDIDLTFIIKVQ
ncbi:MAG: hypothetical protein HC811_07550 [Flammeovirgaceae bacterium]|nr:hypothetical protein [Flammeovirgaceae bacterium]